MCTCSVANYQNITITWIFGHTMNGKYFKCMCSVENYHVGQDMPHMTHICRCLIWYFSWYMYVKYFIWHEKYFMWHGKYFLWHGKYFLCTVLQTLCKTGSHTYDLHSQLPYMGATASHNQHHSPHCHNFTSIHVHALHSGQNIKAAICADHNFTIIHVQRSSHARTTQRAHH